jgi:Protein of unknown function (DUF3592)
MLARPVAAIGNRDPRCYELQFVAMLHRLREFLGITPLLPELEEILELVADGELSIDEAAKQIRELDLKTQPLVHPVILGVFAILGGCFALLGVGIGLYNASFSFGTEQAQATVVRIENDAPVVEYDVKGKQFSFRSSISTSPGSYTVGEKVHVLYRPRDPSVAQIDTFTDRWFLPILFTGIGTIAVLIGKYGHRIMSKLTGSNEHRQSTRAARF